MDSKKKVLVIEAHSDDGAISVSGFLDKYRDIYEYHFLLVAASSMTLRHSGFLSREKRLSEYEAYVNYFNGIWHKNGNIPVDADGKLDTFPRYQLVSLIEEIILAVKPSILISQGPSFHHDHRAVYEAVVAATRPTFGHCPDEIYIMENPTYVHSLGPQTDFEPTLYVSLTATQIQKKVDLYRRCFPSQIREGKNYLSEEGIKSWARYRGIEARCEYAEAFRTFVRRI